MASGPLAADKDVFDTFNHEVYEARWGSVFGALASLLPLERLLRAAWDVEAFRGRSGDEEKREGKSMDLATVDLGIQSDFFWAYAHMLDAIGELLSEVTTWGEGCPCHKRAPEIRGVSRHVRGNQLADEIGQRVCPLRTCMAPACAAGELKDLLRTLLGRCNACLLVVPAMSVLSEQVKRDVLNDFARARAHLTFVWNVKFSHWQQLPWLLFALGHADQDKARQCMRQALSLYDSAPCDHWVCFVLLAPGGHGREQMLMFVEGASLFDLPLLVGFASRFLFAPVTERWVEALHASSKKWLATAPNASVVHLAFFGMQSSLKDLLRQRPGDLAKLAAFCGHVRNPYKACSSMGMADHPVVRGLLQASGKNVANRKFAWLLRRVLFHCDKETLYGDLPDIPGQSSDSSDGEDGQGDDAQDHHHHHHHGLAIIY